MAQSRPLAPFEPNDAYRYKNKEAVDTTIPYLLRIVLLWGSSLRPGETFWQYLLNKYGTNINKLNKALRGKNEELLKTTDSGDFDVTLLKDLVPEVCEDFACKDEAKKRLADGVKTSMTQLADIRNKVCHKPKTFAISPTVLEEIGAIALKLLDKAAKLLSVESQTKQEKIDEVKEMLKRVEEKTMSQKEIRLTQMLNYFLSEGKKEIEKVVERESKELLPASKLQLIRRDVFHEGEVTVVTENANQSKKRNEKKIRFGCLLQHCEGSDIILLGEPGAGKSTFVRRLQDDFVTKKELVFCEVSEFEMMIFMECRKSGIETLADLVRWNFPETFRRIEADQVVEVLLMTKVLFVIDGVDERNPDSEKLLHILVDTFGRCERATFIIASRPGATKYLEMELHSAGRSSTTVKLQPITEQHERIEFLQRYQAKIPGIDAPELINAYKDLDETCKDLVNRPVDLALFCCLYQSSPDEVSRWRNEISPMATILKYSQKLMEKRLEQNRVNNPRPLAKQIMEQACVMSLRQMAENKLTITTETYDNFCKNLFGSKDVPYEAILSCLYVSQPDQETYECIHLSHLEFMAAKAIVKELVEKKRQSVIELISEHAEIQRDGAASSPAITVSLKRFENVLRFVCMLIHERGPPMTGALQRFLEEVCPALARENVGLEYWTDLVLGCPNSDQVARAAAEAAHTVEGVVWRVESSRAMTATSMMLPYCQPEQLVIEPLPGVEDHNALAVLLEEVTRWHTGKLRLIMHDSHANYSACDDSLARLESARCELNSFKGCLSYRSSLACRALRGGVERAEWASLNISLLDPMRHEHGQLDGILHKLCITARPPSSPGGRRRCSLPSGTGQPPTLRVDCRPAAGGGALGDEGAISDLIEDLAPRDMKYRLLFLLHYRGSDDALDELVSTLMARGVRTEDSSAQGWEEARSELDDAPHTAHGIRWVVDCEACDDNSSHHPGERCVRLHL